MAKRRKNTRTALDAKIESTGSPQTASKGSRGTLPFTVLLGSAHPFTLALAVLALLVVVIFLVVPSCRSALSVNVRHYQCEVSSRNRDGVIETMKCVETNEDHGNQDTAGGAGDNRVQFDLPTGSQLGPGRLN